MAHQLQPQVRFRPATPADCSDLAILLDAATRRIAAWFWSGMAAPGQSWMEVGRERMRTATETRSHHSNWHIAELDGQTIGAFYGFPLPSPPNAVDWAEISDVMRPLIELEHVAAGAWLLQAISLFPEFRNRGLAGALLTRAEDVAQGTGATRIVLQVEEVNVRACHSYQRHGYHIQDRRPYVPFPGSDDSGDWLLMAKDLA